MKFQKKTLSIQIQLLLIFFILGIIMISSFVGMYFMNQSIKQERALVQSIQYLENSLIEFQTISIDYSENEEDQKRLFSNQIENFESSFDDILSIEFGYQIYGKITRENTNDTLNNYIKTHEFSREQKILLHCNELWNRLTLYSENIIFKDFSKDSVFSDLELVTIYQDNTSTTSVQKVKKVRKVITQEASSSLSNIKILALQLSHQFADLEERYTLFLDDHILLYNRTLIFIFLLNILCLYIAYRFSSKIIIRPLSHIHNNIKRLINGDLSIRIKIPTNDEIGSIGQAVNTIKTDIVHATKFVEDISKGDLNSKELPQDHESPLFDALKNMQDELRTIREQEHNRNWSIEGQAIFSKILNKSNQDFNSLVDEIIATLVNYLSASQGALFTLYDEDEANSHLELIACYAFEKKKYINKAINIGEGLIGQAWQERSSIFVTDLPENHMSIKSGLGEASPTSLLVVPLLDNQKVFGVIELASFTVFSAHQIHFVETIGQTIAAALYTVKINTRTQTLLSDSKILTEKMKEQEKELSKNVKELQATQDELKRREIQKENEMNSFTQKFHARLEEHQEIEKGLQNEIKSLQNELKLAQSDSTGIRELKAEIENMDKVYQEKIKDLEETVKIKNMRIDKMRKRLKS